MQRVQVCEELDAPVQRAWALVQDFGDISAWARGRVVRVEGTGVGMARHIDGLAGRVVERCETYNDTKHVFSYRLLESPWPVSNYVGSVRLTANGPNKCVIEWAATFETDAPDPEAVRKGVESSFRDGFIPRIRQNLALQV